ncbi:hypothetical protein M4D57_18540 [Brevibacillus borstelensis]|jgi:hypothetical protein|uniref:hypothetical protein n=1 Tax=Brevibacillus borstelensis TaxID=45462 RepID=UPI00203D069E|nr:hypothetical protein [Brevibacillus borstelensis]MCM3560568.1 hypothetical protein [Brevibacillus borstelensis]
MFSDKLSSPIPITNHTTNGEILDYLYSIFKENIMDKAKRPKLFNKFIFINFSKWIDLKSEVFWHLISLNRNERFNILPCNNDVTFMMCPNNCITPTETVLLSDGSERNVCYYRGTRIHWINEIIELANKSDEDIKTWKKKNIIRGIPVQQLYIRFTHGSVDYVIVFEEKYSQSGDVYQYYFVTAFPVFYISKKLEFDQEYQSYQSQLLVPKK